METTHKKRVNLYIDQQLLEFGKRYSHIMGKPLSSLVEDFLRHEEEKTKIFSAEEFLNFIDEEMDTWYRASGQYNQDETDHIENYLRDQEEVEYCRNNPDSIRAKMRIQLIKEQEERELANLEKEAFEMEKRNSERREFIKRWNETLQ